MIAEREAEMKKYKEVPQWWYLALFVVSLGVGIGCSVRLSFFDLDVRVADPVIQYATPEPLMPWWSILLFTAISAVIAVSLGFSTYPLVAY